MHSRRFLSSFLFLVMLTTLLVSSVATSSSHASSLQTGDLQTYESLNLLILIKASQLSNRLVGDEVNQKTKLEIIKESLETSLEQVPFPPNANIGIMAYGHLIDRSDFDESCSEKNVELLLPLQPASDIRNLNALEIRGLGESPAGQALVKASNVFTQTSPNIKTAILLIADGADSCSQEDLVIEAKDFANSNNIVLYTIGFMTNAKASDELRDIAAPGKYSFVRSDLTVERAIEELTKTITDVFTDLNNQIIPIALAPTHTNTPEISATRTIAPTVTDTKPSPASTEVPSQKTPEGNPEPTPTVKVTSTPSGPSGILFVSATIILGILAFGLWFWRFRMTTKISGQSTEAENLVEADERLEMFMKDIYKAYSSVGTEKYMSLELLKQKLLSKYAQEKFDDLLIQARRKYPNKIWIDKDAQGQTLVKIKL